MIIEARCYTLQPGSLPEYLALFQREEGVLDRLLPYMRGFWFAESGTLNTVHHLWQYEDRAGRAVARAQLAADPVMVRFLGKVAPLLYRQHSTVMQGALATANHMIGAGVYDHLSVHFHASTEPGAARHFIGALSEQVRSCAELVCCLSGSPFESGQFVNSALLVCRHASLAARDAAVAAVEACLSRSVKGVTLDAIECALVLPAPFSPWR